MVGALLTALARGGHRSPAGEHYLGQLDHLLAESGVEMVRNADDFVLPCRSDREAQAALGRVQTWIEANGLTLHSEKTCLVDATQPEGFDFLGNDFEQGSRRLRRKTMDRLKETSAKAEAPHQREFAGGDHHAAGSVTSSTTIA